MTWSADRVHPQWPACPVRYVMDASGNEVAVVYGASGREGSAEKVTANARLIASAPDLLAACEALNGWISTSWGTTSEAHQLKLVQDAVRAAIRKAKGEA